MGSNSDVGVEEVLTCNWALIWDHHLPYHAQITIAKIEWRYNYITYHLVQCKRCNNCDNKSCPICILYL